MSTNAQKTAQIDKECADKTCAKEKLIRAKFYRFMAIGCMLSAFVISGYIFEILGHGNPAYIVHNPLVVLLLLLPFLPAVFMAILSKSRRAQAIKILQPYYDKKNASDVRCLKESE
ncbi:MAG TPA: hypothetical protein PK513_00535 [Alphaproteobacteria bacterium]|nr:hypothetical protein [Alphaproteobacteria bacterium]USO06602.1 MAG: hypothetical protein H6859_05450 [Rhodospirillales bacterium]HOO80974.1 hypothetical protein [Alphaproteobacteria bacterium]